MPQLKPDEFAKIAGELTAKDEVKQYVERVLVDGESAAEVGRAFGVTRQAVNYQVKRFFAHWQKVAGAQADWVCVTVRVPKEVAPQIKQIEQQQIDLLEKP